MQFSDWLKTKGQLFFKSLSSVKRYSRLRKACSTGFSVKSTTSYLSFVAKFSPPSKKNTSTSVLKTIHETLPSHISDKY